MGVAGCREQDGTQLISWPQAVKHQPPAPSQTTARCPAALVSELWNEDARLEAMAEPPRGTGPSCPGQHLPACCVDSWFSRPVGISKTNEMEASARQAWGQQGWQLRSKSSRAWHPPCFLSQGPAGLASTAGQWRDPRCLVPFTPPDSGAAARDFSQPSVTFKGLPRVGSVGQGLSGGRATQAPNLKGVKVESHLVWLHERGSLCHLEAILPGCSESPTLLS